MWNLQLLIGDDPKTQVWYDVSGFENNQSPWAEMSFGQYEQAVPLAVKDVNERKALMKNPHLKGARLILDS